MRLLHLARDAFGDWRFLGGLLSLALAVRVSNLLLGFNRTSRLLPQIKMPAAAAPSEREMQRYRRMIGWAHRLAPALNCLCISTAAWWLLRRRGIGAEMKFGVQAGGEGLRAHAWLEYDGRPITNERGLRDRYSVFPKSILQ